MAAIDKTYIDNWEVFDKIRNWAIDKHFTLKNGEEIYLKDYMYYPDLTKEEWDKQKKNYEERYPKWKFEAVLWNTPTYVDIWLIRNCPFEEIQERLKEQYDGGGWSKTAFEGFNNPSLYYQIKNSTSIYDTYQRQGLGKKAKITIKNILGNWFRDRKMHWLVDIREPDGWWYNEKDDFWYAPEEAMPWNCSHYSCWGPLTKKNIINLIRKWNLPKGTVLQFTATWRRYIVHKFNVTVK